MARILVAEDDVHVMRLMSIWLTSAGHEVVEARNGEEAKVLLTDANIDLLVTDVNMPHCDGIELVDWLRREKRLSIPVIALSARCDQASLSSRLAGMGVSIHPKPFSPSKLRNEIQSRLTAGAITEGG